jgi:hypothetical protein
MLCAWQQEEPQPIDLVYQSINQFEQIFFVMFVPSQAFGAPQLERRNQNNCAQFHMALSR